LKGGSVEKLAMWQYVNAVTDTERYAVKYCTCWIALRSLRVLQEHVYKKHLCHYLTARKQLNNLCCHS